MLSLYKVEVRKWGFTGEVDNVFIEEGTVERLFYGIFLWRIWAFQNTREGEK